LGEHSPFHSLTSPGRRDWSPLFSTVTPTFALRPPTEHPCSELNSLESGSRTILLPIPTSRWCYLAAPIRVPTAEARLPKDKSQPASIESVAAILTRCKTSLIGDWLARAKKTRALNHLDLSDKERTGHLPKLVDDLVARLSTAKVPGKDSDAVTSPAAIEHGKLRKTQGYSAAMLIHESRILRVATFGTLHKKSQRSGFQLALARCHDHRGRSGCTVDTNDGCLCEGRIISRGLAQRFALFGEKHNCPKLIGLAEPLRDAGQHQSILSWGYVGNGPVRLIIFQSYP
jgi:hypothetical protein